MRADEFFMIGDKVMVVKEPLQEKPQLKIHTIYTIEGFGTEYLPGEYIKIHGIAGYWSPDRFALLNHKMKIIHFFDKGREDERKQREAAKSKQSNGGSVTIDNGATDRSSSQYGYTFTNTIASSKRAFTNAYDSRIATQHENGQWCRFNKDTNSWEFPNQ